ncbi:unnamed protein product [Caenorhabditis brenneri]
MTTKKKLNQEELAEAFGKFMPKRPVYPRLAVFCDQEVMENDDTDSDLSDCEEDDPRKRQKIYIEIKDVMTPDCERVWKNARCKRPSQYLADNVQGPLEVALEKLANLKVKPTNPIEWLGYCLYNMNVKNPRPPTMDHLLKPTMAQRRFQLSMTCDPEIIPISMMDHSYSRLPAIRNPVFAASGPLQLDRCTLYTSNVPRAVPNQPPIPLNANGFPRPGIYLPFMVELPLPNGSEAGPSNSVKRRHPQPL